MNKLASNGEIAEPCGVPRSRATRYRPVAAGPSASAPHTTGPTAGRCGVPPPSGHVPRNGVEERLDVQIKDPVDSQHRSPAHPDRVQRGPSRPIAVGVRMEHRLHPRLQIHPADRLGDPVRHRRHPQHPALPSRLRYLHRPHRRREIASPTTAGSRACRGYLSGPPQTPRSTRPSTPAAPLLALTLRYASQTARLSISNGFALRLAQPAPPVSSPVDRRPNPDNPSPSLHPHYQASPLLRDGPPLCLTSVLCPSQIPLLGILPYPRTRTNLAGTHRGERFPRSTQEPGPSSRHLHAGRHLARKQEPPRLIPGQH